MKLLTRSTPYKDSARTGKYFLDLLRDTSWIQRRVETVRLLEQNQFERSVSLTLDVDEIKVRLERAGLVDVEQAYVPLFTLVKTFLLDFDVCGANGEPLPLATSAQDSFAAQAVLLARLEESGTDPSALSPQVIDAIYDAARRMPDDSTLDDFDLIDSESPIRDYWVSRAADLFSSNVHRKQWRALFEDAAFCKLFADFTTQAMALAPVTLKGRSMVVKYRHIELESLASEPSFWEASGLTSFAYILETKSIGTSQREHIRIIAPSGANMSSVQLQKKVSSLHSAEELGYAADTYNSRVTAERAVVYTRQMPPGDYIVVAAFRPRVSTFVAPAMFSVGLSVLLLAVVAGLHIFNQFYFDRGFDDIGLFGGIDRSALATSLLLGPTLLSIFIVRPGEHSVVGRLLLRPRIMVLLTAFTLVISALAVAVGARGVLLACVLGGSFVLCVLAFAVLTLIYVQCVARAKATRRSGYKINHDHVMISPYFV
jgi:hypothetical protein